MISGTWNAAMLRSPGRDCRLVCPAPPDSMSLLTCHRCGEFCCRRPTPPGSGCTAFTLNRRRVGAAEVNGLVSHLRMRAVHAPVDSAVDRKSSSHPHADCQTEKASGRNSPQRYSSTTATFVSTLTWKGQPHFSSIIALRGKLRQARR
jgi:hypothetical protein